MVFMMQKEENLEEKTKYCTMCDNYQKKKHCFFNFYGYVKEEGCNEANVNGVDVYLSSEIVIVKSSGEIYERDNPNLMKILEKHKS